MFKEQAMITEFITPVDNKYTLNLPDEMLGKTIQVIAFEIGKDEAMDSVVKSVQKLQDIKDRYAKLPLISHDNYQFNRDDANDYE